MAAAAGPGLRDTVSTGLLRLVAFADDPADSDDVRLRKHVGVTAGYLTIVAPLSMPFQAGFSITSWSLAIGLSVYAAVNLVVLERTRNFDRYVVVLLIGGVIFVPAASFLAGGITGSSSGLGWAFLVPAYAILALGPRRAIPWFVVYLGLVGFMVLIDPLAAASTAARPYLIRLTGQLENGVIPLVIVFALLVYTDSRRLAAERRADELLTNAIPVSIATRLRHGEHRIAESYEATSVVFADLAGFTPWARHRTPAEVVATLDALFTRIDAAAEHIGLEKIKTIGDAYMAVAGAPEPRPDHAVAAVEFGRAVIKAVAEARGRENLALEVRVGIASGPLVGGVIGDRRQLFDLWGDTVNTAQRVEASGVPGRVHVAESTATLLPRSRYELERREVEVKGLGLLTTYLVG